MAGTNLGLINGIGPLGNTSVGANFTITFARVVSQTIGVMTIFAGLWFIAQLFQGAYSWISAGGDKQAVENAKKRLTNAIIGLGIVVAAYGLIGIVGAFLGLDILNVGGLIRNAGPF